MKKLLVIFGLLLFLILEVSHPKNLDNPKQVEKESTSNYSTINMSFCRTFDVNNFDEMYKNSDLIVIGTVKQKLKAEKNSDQPVACTPGKLEILRLMKGEFTKNILLNFLIPGGMITLEEYENSIKNISPERIKKEQLDKIDNNFKKTNYVEYISRDYKDFSVSKTFIMFLNKIGDSDNYAVISSTGMIPIEDYATVTNIQDVSKLFEINKQ